MQNREGFTIIEVMVATMIIATVLASLWGLQSGVLTSASSFRDRLARLWFAQKTFYRARREQAPDAAQFSLKDTAQNPSSNITYELKQPAKNSSLAKQHRLFVEQVDAQGKTKQDKQNQERIVSLIYKQEPAS